MKQKYIITQIPPESADLTYYFDGDTFTPDAGGIQYALFILFKDRFRVDIYPEQNRRTWEEITQKTDDIMCGIEDAANRETDWNGDRITVKSVMIENGLKYSPTAAHRLKEWSSRNKYSDDPRTVAEYLTLTTGHKWSTASASGYCQGDYAEIVYCADVYSRQDARAAGEIALGAANEYSITFPAEDGSEPETVYGYIVADCQAWRPEDVKRLVCEWEGIDPAEAVLMTIEDSYTRTEYKYTEAC